MRKIHKIINTTLIFMLIGVLLCNSAYALRPFLQFNQKKQASISLRQEYNTIKRMLKKWPSNLRKPVFKIWVICDEDKERSPIVAKIIRDSIPKELQAYFSIKSYGLSMAKNIYADHMVARDPGLRKHKSHIIPYYRAGSPDLILVMTDRQKQKVQQKLKARGISTDKVRMVKEGEDLHVFVNDITVRSRYRDFRNYIKDNKNIILLPIVSLFRSKLEEDVFKSGIITNPNLTNEQLRDLSDGGRIVERDGKLVVLKGPPTWGVVNTSFETINLAFSDFLNSSLLDRIVNLAKSKGEKPLYVLEWGAGTLRAAIELSNELKKIEIKNVYIIAFGDTRYSGIKELPDNILSIVDVESNLVRRVKENIGDISIDVIYSYAALHFLLEDDYTEKEFIQYLMYLEKLLSDGVFQRV